VGAGVVGAIVVGAGVVGAGVGGGVGACVGGGVGAGGEGLGVGRTLVSVHCPPLVQSSQEDRASGMVVGVTNLTLYILPARVQVSKGLPFAAFQSRIELPVQPALS